MFAHGNTANSYKCCGGSGRGLDVLYVQIMFNNLCNSSGIVVLLLNNMVLHFSF
jgi:hypothetical protein